MSWPKVQEVVLYLSLAEQESPPPVWPHAIILLITPSVASQPIIAIAVGISISITTSFDQIDGDGINMLYISIYSLLPY